MKAGTGTEEGVSAVPLVHAAFCVNCETISNSPHDACAICGSHSLVGLYKLLGGTLRGEAAPPARIPKYNLELSARVQGVPAAELNHVIESITRLAESGSEVQWLRIEVESVFDTKDVRRAA